MKGQAIHGEPKIEQPKPYNDPRMYTGAQSDSSFFSTCDTRYDSSSFSTCDTRLATHVKNLIISHIRKLL